MDIGERALLVLLRISSWSASKRDKDVSIETAKRYDTTVSAGRYIKNLLPVGSTSYRLLTATVDNARWKHHQQTLAWGEDGWRLLPVANYMKYTEEMRKYRNWYDSALNSFFKEYLGICETAKLVLKEMYNEKDYPSIDELKERYSFTIQYSPISRGSDFRLTLMDEDVRRITCSIEDRVKTSIEESHKDAIHRLYESVNHILEKLAASNPRFRNSLIENARELCDALTRLNVTEDDKLEGIRQSVEKLLSVDVQQLRESESIRYTVVTEADNIARRMRDIYKLPGNK